MKKMRTLQNLEVPPLRLSLLIGLACLALTLCSCRSTKTATERIYVHLHDSITVYDTCYVPVTVTKLQADSNALNLAASKNDSLLNVIDSQQQRLEYLANLLKQGKLSSDTVHANTDLAHAWAYLHNNRIKLGIEQLPFDTLLAVVNSHTKVTDKTTDKQSEQKVVEVEVNAPWYKNTWFWIFTSTILLLVLLHILCMKLGWLRWLR